MNEKFFDEIRLEADLEKLDEALDFIEKNLQAWKCSMKIILKIKVAVEEIFVNIAHYAYKPGKGDVKITIKRIDEADQSAVAEITFADSGTPYNPLAKPDPDITLSAKDRPIGGLGIFMVKKSMDYVDYEYKDGKNIFTMRKKI